MDTMASIILLNEQEIIKKLFWFEVLTAVGFKITVLWEVTLCISVERLHVSKQSYIFIFDFIISIFGNIAVYSLHRVCCSFWYYYSQGFCYSWLLYLPGNCYQRTMSAHDLSRDVLEKMECPVCMEYMLPTIR